MISSNYEKTTSKKVMQRTKELNASPDKHFSSHEKTNKKALPLYLPGKAL